jgi:unsaturated rhamnogalacturonyl hydrolase
MANDTHVVRQLEEIVVRAADLLLRYPWKVWFWGDSIGLEGLLDASEWLGEKKYEAFVYGLMKAWLARCQPPRPFDYTAPGVALLRLYERLADPALLRAAEDHADYLAAFRQTDHGAFVRWENPDFDLPPEIPAANPGVERVAPSGAATASGPCVFVDTMHFDGPFFARLYQVTGAERYRRLAVTAILPYVRLLFDEDDGLFHHFWIERRKRRNGVFWGRGQGWAMLGIVHVLEHLPHDDPAWPILLSVFQRHSGALAAAQDPSGHWHTVITDSSSYTESSIAAFVVDGLSRGLHQGWLDPSYRAVIERAVAALLPQVAGDGKLDGVSYETYPSLNPEHYRLMPRGAVVPWGQGPLLTAIRSYAQLLQFL